ncbi:WD40/YVTN/BNR-like repeat-containing protein [Idiomarina sp. HP20-50]|uniref:WD40/YVTN/BNR-like repeat-containing protein n=1 Tax=Idiomarina sp. HP20-50 TaxID=3070813 RepID=UPI00294AA197|nr:YCF48-related protein [Idiomarina sp. HP20-50]MDV6315029.1 YCF48-related protein [Idiomarina sp. HP20-50]
MRSSFAPVGVLLGALLSTSLLAQESDTTIKDYDVITAPALPSDEIRSEVLIEITQVGDRLVAAGAHGNIIWRDTADSEWQQADVNSSILITSLGFSNETIGWATGHHGVLLKTEDGGKTWRRKLDGFDLIKLEEIYYEQRISDLKQRLESVDDSDEASEIEWLLEDLQFRLSNIEMAMKEGPSKPLLDVYAVDNNTIYVIGAYGTFLETNDGGKSWKVVADKLDNPNGYHLNAIFGSNDTLYIAGESGMVFRSLDKGENWKRLESPYRGSLFGGHVDTQQRLWIYGLRGNAFVSDDKGDSFTKIETGVGVNLSAGTTSENENQLIVGHSGVILKVKNDFSVEKITHPSGSVMTDIITLENGEWLMTGRSGLLHWPAQSEKTATAEKQGVQ